MTEVKVKAGICGFETTIKAETRDDKLVELNIDSNCPSITKAADKIEAVDPLQEPFKKLHQTSIYKSISPDLPHPSCPVYSGLLKAVEVEAGLALAKNAVIEIKE